MTASDALELATDAPTIQPVRKGMWGGGPGDVSGFGGISRPIQYNSRATRPYGGWFDEVIDQVLGLVPDLPEEVSTDRGELTIYVPKDLILEVVRATRDDAALRFETCTSVCAVHYPDDLGAELHVVYALLSMTHNRRIRLEVVTSDEDPVVPSVGSVYPHTDWHEREIWDMFGVIFEGHSSLTRILMPDDWDGHPGRKDYPLGGITMKFKGAEVPPPDERRSY
jgi:NADH-quinone oxidoreductase subunit C